MRSLYVCLPCRLKAQLPFPHRAPTLLLRTFTTTPYLRTTPPPNASQTTSSSSSSSSSPRPSTAPKPFPNIRHIRENASLYAKNCIDRNYAALSSSPFEIRDLSAEAARLQEALKQPRSRIKLVEKSIAKIATDIARSSSSSSRGGNGEGGENNAAAGVAAATKREELDTLRREAGRLKDESADLLSRREKCLEEIQNLALALPNLTSAETPRGNVPKVVGYINYDPACPPSYAKQHTTTATATTTTTRSHVAIGTRLGLLDFSSSATSTGWGWYFLLSDAALLEQALIQYSLSVAARRGWTPVSPPSIVYSHIAEACGFQPRDAHNEQQIYAIEQSSKDKGVRPARCLAGTAEIPLAAMYAGKEVGREALPARFVGASRCYRAEAGARGVDTKGLYRVHEFTKVELFAWADDILLPPSNTSTTITEGHGVSSTTLFNEILDIQTEILASLNLPCRILEMPSGDLGASATRKRDIEVLFPSRLRSGSSHHISLQEDSKGEASALEPSPSSPAPSSSVAAAAEAVEFDDSGWGEVTSASICTDYQSRRLGTRVRDSSSPSTSSSSSSSATRFPHTVNGTAMAVPRVLAAILENGYDEGRGVVVIPEVLRVWMGGKAEIGGRK
ncbi:hypothetical protein AJ80_08795 [Polytolypa hystricis UAMH7299]|uniref:serine--tRNA ligase n=1 Tax=Polytolypa hystricis (strain UAMH7299) TaxID=1447883 RepID=A0A2B7X1P4_POLH7|nr:hypothetical protein AJ80_08795 [Polytolypa hystricis UAMH7299]